jgi:hypothetical protein
MTKANLNGAVISIGEDGAASMIALGQSGSFKVEVLEETPIYLKIGARSQPPEKAWTYDKGSKLLVFSVEIDNSGRKGTMPAYFRKSRN